MASIYQSSNVSTNADIAIENPFPSFRYIDSDDALSGGSLYFGIAGRDGEVEENRKRVFAILESGASLPIEQPVKLSSGGQPSYNGNAVQLAVDGSYSLKMKDKDGVKVAFAPKVTAKTLLGYSGVIPEEVKEKTGETLTFNVIEASTASLYIANGRAPGTVFNGVLMQKDVDYEVVSESTIRFKSTYLDGSAILGRVLDPTGQTVSVSQSTKPIFLFDTHADVLPASLSVGDSVIIGGKDTLNDGKGGSYVVTSGGGAVDGYNVITLDDGNQLNIKKTYQALQGIYETVNSQVMALRKFTLDATTGSVFKLALTEDCIGIDITNIPANGELKIEVKITQNADTAYTLDWLINGKSPKASGGTIPTLTAELGAYDRYIILTDDGGSSFELYTAGQDIK